ncbi:amidophosphoribosyltransferase-like [Planococcus citri]|uniref:amidophosphoribosyltransferase-like n=1 Tax=Planococcus citri TaxID=170843 RepID=UPI0031F7D465
MSSNGKEEFSTETSGLTHECGVFGCIGTGNWPAKVDVAQTICLGLVHLQHRGQESAGIVTSSGHDVDQSNVKKGMGLISNIFNDDTMNLLKGNLGIGHTRYSTQAGSSEVNCQPFIVHTIHGDLAIAHNGEIINSSALRQKVLSGGVGLPIHSDSKLITQALCLNPPDDEHFPDGSSWSARIKHLMRLSPLSYSLVLMEKDRIYGVRDPYGNRPLCIGKIPIDEQENDSEPAAWVISSESCSFISIGAIYVREVLPGEIVEITRDGVQTISIVERPDNRPPAFCIFEYIYFARADSIFEGQTVYSVRLQCGKMLARESLVDADIVSSIPESGTAAALGFSQETGIRFSEVLCKNRYVGRSFIQPSDRLRKLGVGKKFGILSENVKEKSIILIDDSIVRGNTISQIVRLLKNAGAKKVHVRIASPPVLYPCYMGINTPTKEELIANQLDNVGLANYTGADSLAYLSVNGLLVAVQHGIKTELVQNSGYCTACLTGKYPSELEW